MQHLSNLMITMVLGGLWHGAGFNFLIWGALHGGYLIVNTLFAKRFSPPLNMRTPSGFVWVASSWICTFVAVNYAWLYFRCSTFSDAMLANTKIFSWLKSPKLPEVYPGVVALIFIVLAIELVQRFLERNDYKKIYNDSICSASLLGVLAGFFLVAGIVFLLGVPTQQFIYFQF